MRILLLGANGQVGWELRRSLAPLGEVTACDRQTADLEELDGLAPVVRNARADIIVNAAAYTRVDEAESQPDKARRINAEAVRVLAEAAGRSDALFVTYSTDYVFDGHGQAPYAESDSPNPLNVYGSTKLAGEEAVRATGCRHLIFRTSWVYARRGRNFIKTMLDLARTRDQLRVVCDQVGAPTHAGLIADVTALVLYELGRRGDAARIGGTYHLTPRGAVSWHDYAGFVISRALSLGVELRLHPDRILPVSTPDYPQPAERPLNSRLDTEKLRSTFGLTLPTWEYDVARTVSEILMSENGR
jgi:dTDP-4-dehydrorhamnose reductase